MVDFVSLQTCLLCALVQSAGSYAAAHSCGRRHEAFRSSYRTILVDLISEEGTGRVFSNGHFGTMMEMLKFCGQRSMWRQNLIDAHNCFIG